MCRVCPLRRCRRASHESRSKVFAAKVQDARYIVGRAGRGSNHTQLALGARALVTQKRYGGDHNKGASVSVVRISPKASCSLRRRKRRRIWCCMPCPVAGATLRRRQRRRICDGSAARIFAPMYSSRRQTNAPSARATERPGELLDKSDNAAPPPKTSRARASLPMAAAVSSTEVASSLTQSLIPFLPRRSSLRPRASATAPALCLAQRSAPASSPQPPLNPTSPSKSSQAVQAKI